MSTPAFAVGSAALPRSPGGAGTALRKALVVAWRLGRSQLAYPGEVLTGTLFLATQLLVCASLWRMLAQTYDVRAMTGMTPQQLVYYLAFTEAVYMSANPLPDGIPVDREVRSGDIAYRLARPMGYATYHLAAHLGERAASFVLKLGALSVVALALVGWPALSLSAVAAALVAALLGFVADAAWTHAIAFLSFWVEDTYGLHLLYRRSVMLLGGLLIPLAAYPDWLRRIAEALPFQLLLCQPGRLFVAAGPTGFLRLVLLQSAFAGVGFLLLALCARAGLRRLAAQGG